MSKDPKKPILLSIARVDFNGNTGDGEYFYSFYPQTIFTHDKDAKFVVKFTERTTEHFEMVSMITSDAEDQLRESHVMPGKREIHAKNLNTKRKMINVSIVVRDTKSNLLINCDPQVLNDPDPEND